MNDLVEWQGVLSACYVKRPAQKNLVHLVALVPLIIGRVKRTRGETLCKRILPEHMTGSQIDPATSIKCRRCDYLFDMLSGNE